MQTAMLELVKKEVGKYFSYLSKPVTLNQVQQDVKLLMVNFYIHRTILYHYDLK